MVTMKYIALVSLCACTMLGPMPATTAVSAVPNGPGVEAQEGIVPGFYLAGAAQNKPYGGELPQFGAVFEPGRWLGLRGLILGARVFGEHKDQPGEPLIGYRRALGDSASIAGIVFGTSKRTTRSLASYHGARYGAELAFDAQLLDPTSWLAIHMQFAAAASRIVASGTYCADNNGIAIDCDLNHPGNNDLIEGRASGVFPSGTVTVAADALRKQNGLFHGVRLALLISVGEMPLVKSGVQQSSGPYFSGGLTLTLGFGGTRSPISTSSD
jgi:hypothetical protein